MSYFNCNTIKENKSCLKEFIVLEEVQQKEEPI